MSSAAMAEEVGVEHASWLRRAGVAIAPAAAWLGEIGAQAALVRPDRYVLGIAADADGVARLLDAVPSRRMAETGVGRAG